MGRYRGRQRLPSFAVLPILHYCNRASAAAQPSPILQWRHGGIFAGRNSGSRISTLYVAVAVIQECKKNAKTPYSTPVLLGLLHFALGTSSEHRIACRVFTRKQHRKTLVSNWSRKPLLLLYSTTYYYIVLHSILHRVT